MSQCDLMQNTLSATIRCNRCAAFVHAVIVIPLAAQCLSSPDLNKDRTFGWDGDAGRVLAISCGLVHSIFVFQLMLTPNPRLPRYFLWDTLECLVHFVDVGFVIHGWSRSPFVVCLLSGAFQVWLA